MKRKFSKKTRVRKFKRNYRRKLKRKFKKFRLTTRFDKGIVTADRTFAKFTFSDYYNFGGTQSLGVPFSFQFRGNNAYDPQVNVGGGTPSGYADYANRYQTSTVIGSSIKIVVGDNGTDAAYPFAVTVVPRRTPAALLLNSELNSIMEVKYSRQVIVEPTQSSSFAWRRTKNYMTTAKMFGVPSSQVKSNVNDYAHATLSTSNPLNSWYWTIYIHAPWDPLGTITMTTHTRVIITYYVMFSNSTLIPTA